MKLKTIVFSAALLIADSAIAQDKIIKVNGEVIEATIKTVGIRSITYSRFDNQAGPEYTIAKREVTKIRYQNGSEDNFEKQARMPRHRFPKTETKSPDGASAPRKVYGRNIMTVSPLQFTENGLGFGLSYERMLDDEGIISFYFPLAGTFNLNSRTYVNYGTGLAQNGHQDFMFYLMPGVKIYPTGSGGRVRYSVGPSLVWATGEKSDIDYTSSTPYVYHTNPHTMLGMIVNNTLNICPNEHIYLGLELGLGFSYFNRVNDLNQEMTGIVQGGFRIGYRF